MTSPQNIAIIGCGSMGRIHAQCLSMIPGARIIVFCDIDEERAREMCRTYRGAYCTTNVDAVLRDDTIDAVYICTQHDTHSVLAVKAAKAGKHIMIEKPLALTIEDCYSIGEAVEKHGVKLMTAFKLRYYPAVAKVKQLIPKPLVTVAQMMDARWADDFWANDPLRGGGNVLSQGGHTMDLLYHLNESEPVRIYAEGGNLAHPDLEIVDNIVATVQFANGSLGSVVQGDSGPTPFVSKFSFQVMDGMRTAHLHNRLKSATLFDGDKVVEYEDSEEYGLLEENRDFIRALQEDTEPPITYRDGLRATLLVLKAFEALRSGVPQELEL